MHKASSLSLMFLIFLLASASVYKAQAETLLTGKKKSACEAILCLSTSKNPAECSPSLQEYFSITADTPWELFEERLNFLKQCPSSNASDQMQSLVVAIAHGAGKCDVPALNKALTTYTYSGFGQIDTKITSNKMPDYCSVYFNHEYTDFKGENYPVYVGTPAEGGYWVDSQNYNTELAAYEEKIKSKAKKKYSWE